MEEEIKNLDKQFTEELEKTDSPDKLEALKTRYLGRKGLLGELFQKLSGVEASQRPHVGQMLNVLKESISNRISEKAKELAWGKSASQTSGIDVTLPGLSFSVGHRHVLTQTMQQVSSIFGQLGFSVAEGPEVETEYYNFRALNIPADHPAHDAFHTFYLESPQPLPCRQAGTVHPSASLRINGPQKRSKKSGLSTMDYRLLLRSQTSTVQIRVMEKHKPPLRIISPGKVYRPDATDASHSFMFHQIEGFSVDEGVRFSDLKGTLFTFAAKFFGQDIKMRFRPHYFPFTEPSVEVDISCIICKRNQKPVTSNQKKNCPVCHGKGWLEILGAGMIHPNVLRGVNYNTRKYTGFAFGMGVERLSMLKYGIDDIRLFFENDLRFLQQF